MRNQNLYTMKQPDLGKKISEIRKQKGLTQEELVEQCNINVRTIQRIEAGEVTPRSFTIKTILEVLGVDYNEIIKPEEQAYEKGKFDTILGISKENFTKVINVSWIFGIVYFIFGYVEVAYELNYFYKEEVFFSNTIYILVKVVSIIAFTLFFRGFVATGSYYKNDLLEFMAFLILILNVFFGLGDIASLYFIEDFAHYITVAKIITFGVLGIFFGIGLLKLRTQLGNLALATGILEIITGFFFATIILTILGLFTMFPMELLEIVLLYRVASKVKSVN